MPPSPGVDSPSSARAESATPRRVVVLGSTGSIGRQALEVIEAHPDRFTVVGLAAGGSRPDLLAEQSRRHPDARLAIADSSAADRRTSTLTGPDAATELAATTDADVVLNGITGSIGLAPTLAALQAGRTLALANKESLIAGGRLVLDAAAPGQIVPVDSEHSALAQCLRGGATHEVAALVLTASGGPFRGRRVHELQDITVADAMAHPTWDMGPVITVNSATLVNKGLELIEAHLLFDVPYERIQVVVHPQSVIHSMVTFRDGSTLAQASPPDMKLAIALGLSWPNRLDGVTTPCDFGSPASWTFEPLDDEAFPAVRMAREAGLAGGMVPAAWNAANEEAVDAFRSGTLPFLGIYSVLEGILEEAGDLGRAPRDIDDVLATETWARTRARELIRASSGADRAEAAH